MNAKIRINPEKTLFEVTTPDEEVYGPLELDEDPFAICADEGTGFLAVTGENDYGLEVNRVYQLVPVETEVELDALITEEDDEEEIPA